MRSRRSLTVLLLLPMMLQQPAFSQSKAWERAGRLGMGINLSWLENYWNGSADKNYADYLDIKALPPRKQQLAFMHQLGFKTLRLPVTFDRWASPKPPYPIVMTHYFQAVDSILQWAKMYDLNVIIDNHHGALDDSTRVMQELPRVVAIWKQIADRYKNTDPERVFFEIYNEPHQMTDDQWKACALQLIKAIRDIAPRHTLIVGGAGWNSISGLEKLGKLPDDNIIYTFHFYDPFLFTHQGATWAGAKATSNIHIPFPYRAADMPGLNPESKGTWGANNYRDYPRTGSEAGLKKELETARDFSQRYHVPVFCGEWGSYNKYADEDSRCRYTATIKKLLDQMNIPFAYWEWDQGFSFFNGRPSLKNIPACMQKAWGFPVSP